MSFPLIGNTGVKNAVLSAISEKKLPHAVIIEGERGTGRHTLADFIARAALCFGEDAPCGECRSCTLSKAGTHPDISVTSAESGKKNITVDRIRALRSEAYVKPHIASGRVFIIDGADTMNEQAQNALLKVLEEPPGEVYFILVSESKSALLNTVISRCTVLSLTAPEISAAEEYILTNYAFEKEAVTDAANGTNGNIGAALEILKGESAPLKSAAADFVGYMLDGDIAEMLNCTLEAQKSRTDAAAFFKELRLAVSAASRAGLDNRFRLKSLLNLYGELNIFEQTLNTNINLALLFCALTSKAYEITKN